MIWKCFCKWKIDLKWKKSNLENRNRTVGRSAFGANGVSFGLYALSFGGWSKRRVVWRLCALSFACRIKRRVVRIRKKRRVVSCYQTTCRSSVAGLFSLVKKTTSFWRKNFKHNKPFLSSSSSYISRFSLSLLLSLLESPPLSSLPLPRWSDKSPEVIPLFSLLFYLLHFVHFIILWPNGNLDFWMWFWMNLGSKFMGFDGESMRNMIGTWELIFGRVFDEGYFGPKFQMPI